MCCCIVALCTMYSVPMECDCGLECTYMDHSPSPPPAAMEELLVLVLQEEVECPLQEVDAVQYWPPSVVELLRRKHCLRSQPHSHHAYHAHNHTHHQANTKSIQSWFNWSVANWKGEEVKESNLSYSYQLHHYISELVFIEQFHLTS